MAAGGGAISGVVHLALRAAHLEGGTSPFQPLPGARWQRAAPGAGARHLGRAGCCMPPFPRQLGAGRLLPGSVLGLSPPGEDYSARRSLRAAHTPPPLAAIPASCPSGAGLGSPERGCARRAGQGRCGRWPRSGAVAGWSWAAPAPSRAGERLLAASPPRPDRSCRRGS